MLGGTEFVGRAVTEAALERDWQVTVFHRGHHAPPPGVRVLTGDRTGGERGLAALAGHAGDWDLVVDTWSGVPTAVRDSARLLAGRAGHYSYVSSRSVYAYPAPAGLDEGGPLVTGASPDEDGREGDVPYDRAKRGGELAALDTFGDRALLARAGLIIGPGENIGRLPWWLSRIARGGPVIAPGPRTTEPPVRRCARPGELAPGRRDGRAARRVQHRQPPRPHHHRRTARRLCPGHRLRRRAALDGPGHAACRRGRALDRAADLAAGEGAVRHPVPRRPHQGRGRGAALPGRPPRPSPTPGHGCASWAAPHPGGRTGRPSASIPGWRRSCWVSEPSCGSTPSYRETHRGKSGVS